MIKRFHKDVEFYWGKHLKKRTVLDFDSLRKEKFPIIIIQTERGWQGKSFNAKEHLLDRWNDHGERAVWLFNTEELIKKTQGKFLEYNRKTYPERWKNFSVNFRGVEDHQGRTIIHFVSVNGADTYKGARIPDCSTFVYDEFNVSMGLVRTKQTSLFQSIIHTYSDVGGDMENVKAFAFANQKANTVAAPFLTDLGFTNLTKELETSYNSDEFEGIIREIPLAMFYRPKGGVTSRDLSKDWLAQYSKKTGNFESDYGNVNTHDSMVGVFQLEGEDLERYDSIGYARIEGRLYELASFSYEGIITYHALRVDEFDPVKLDRLGCCYFLPEDADVGTPNQNIDLKKPLQQAFWDGQMSFQDYATKLAFTTVLAV